MNRSEHLQWCKDRAMEYVRAGQLENAMNSMLSDLGKHEETKNHATIQLMVMLRMSGQLSTSREVADFIQGFN